MTPPVTITKKAIEEIRQIIDSKKVPAGYGLRIGVRGGACGASMVLGFDQKQENDSEFLIEGIQVFIKKRETMFIIGKEVDFYEGADERGFVFNDPQESQQ